jgi:hypothetical protein
MDRSISARRSWHHMRWIAMRHRYPVWVAWVNERRPVDRSRRRAILLWEWLTLLSKVRGHVTVNLNALPTTYVVEVGKIEIRNMTLQESIALSDLALDKLCVTSESEGLPMSVLLLTRDASSRARRAFRMFRVALNESIAVSEKKLDRRTEICGRCLPTGLALIFLLLHRAQASWERLRRLGSEGEPASSELVSAFRPLFLEVVGACC